MAKGIYRFDWKVKRRPRVSKWSAATYCMKQWQQLVSEEATRTNQRLFASVASPSQTPPQFLSFAEFDKWLSEQLTANFGMTTKMLRSKPRRVRFYDEWDVEADVSAITAGIDVAENRMTYEILGWDGDQAWSLDDGEVER